MKSLLFVGPILTASGYGTHSRQCLRALVDSGIYDVYAESIRWGETSFLHGTEFDWIQELCRKRERAGDRKYDVSVQVTIPNEFRRRARLNVGITAGIEVDRVSPTWLLKTNEEVDVVVVPSYHSARGFADTKYRSQDGQVLGLQRPIAVVAESFSEEYHPRVDCPASVLDGIDLSPVNFLVVGLGLDKPLGEDRKNISNTVLWFLREFAGRTDVSLILKASVVNGSLIDFSVTQQRLRELRELSGVGSWPAIHLLHGRMSERELADLYRDPRVTALVSLTHGEGFGLPMLEAAACGLPVIATDWSGHVDFLTVNGEKLFVPVEYDLREIPASCVWPGVMEQGSRWAIPLESSATAALRALAEDPGQDSDHRARARRLSEHIHDNYSQARLQSELVSDIETAWLAMREQRPETREELAAAVRSQLRLSPGEHTVLFTMPMSGGDVYLSTAVVRELRVRHTGHRLIFSTDPKYAGILEGNADIDQVVDWQPWMQDVGLLEDIFDEVYTPNLAIQMTHSNWVHGGRGRNLLHEIAVQCGVDPDGMAGPAIRLGEVPGMPESYVVIHTGSGRGQWGARRYNHWQDVVGTVGPILAEHGVSIVQVGLADEPALRDVVDMRGRTDYRQLARVVSGARAVLSIDSIVMHLAAHHAVPHVALFGGSYASSTGTGYGGMETVTRAPWESWRTPRSLMETTDRMGCERACYKNECRVDPESPCINNIDPAEVCYQIVSLTFGRQDVAKTEPKVEELPGGDLLLSVDRTMTSEVAERARSAYRPRRPMISGYTHTFNALTHDYPFLESIGSMLGFCAEVVVVDGGSIDRTVECVRERFGTEPRVKLIHNAWDHEEPGMDGMQKAFGRVMCDPKAEFLWQQDCDEVVHEDDYERVLEAARRFPSSVPVLHLPVVELWGDESTVRTDRHAWKWRLSRNEFNVTHGIVKHARVLDSKTGRVYSKPGMSDGCEYIDVMTGEYLPHTGFWTEELERLRTRDPVEYGHRMNAVFGRLPCVFHYSWADIPRKVRNFRDFWDRQWSRLYNETKPTNRFPDVISDDDVARKAEELRARGGEHAPAPVFGLERTAPAIMREWMSRRNG